MIFFIAGFGWIFIFYKKPAITIAPSVDSAAKIGDILIDAEEKTASSSSDKTDLKSEKLPVNSDIEPQKPLLNPPETIKGVYMTSWSAASDIRVNGIIEMKKNSGLNAVIVDIKDYSGLIAYDIKLPQSEEYKTKEIRIRKLNSLIKKFHDNGIYAIARITVFQDPALAKARPDLAVKKKENASSTPPYPTWYDRKGLAWTDPSSKEVWDYNIAIAKDALARGFDEINFDYIRFPSDGDMKSMYFSFWDQKIPRDKIIQSFFKYTRESLPEAKLSADLFGLVTINKDDLGIGQILEDAYQYFDFVSPMVYPSHYYSGTLGYSNPAEYPYEIIKYSMDSAAKRLQDYEFKLISEQKTATSNAENGTPKQISKIRPWLQDFSLGTVYTLEMVKLQIKAVSDSLGNRYNGYMLWNPSNFYTQKAIE